MDDEGHLSRPIVLKHSDLTKNIIKTQQASPTQETLRYLKAKIDPKRQRLSEGSRHGSTKRSYINASANDSKPLCPLGSATQVYDDKGSKFNIAFNRARFNKFKLSKNDGAGRAQLRKPVKALHIKRMTN